MCPAIFYCTFDFMHDVLKRLWILLSKSVEFHLNRKLNYWRVIASGGFRLFLTKVCFDDAFIQLLSLRDLNSKLSLLSSFSLLAVAFHCLLQVAPKACSFGVSQVFKEKFFACFKGFSCVTPSFLGCPPISSCSLSSKP